MSNWLDGQGNWRVHLLICIHRAVSLQEAKFVPKVVCEPARCLLVSQGGAMSIASCPISEAAKE